MKMLEVKDILSINFYKKSPFYGSLSGLRYRIIKDETEGERLKCTTWPEPFGYEATDEKLKEHYYSSFDEKGLEDIAAHINNKVSESSLAL